MVIDQIQLKVGSGQNTIGLAEWKEMELTERIDIINEDRVQFLSGGQLVSIRDAMVAIKAAAK